MVVGFTARMLLGAVFLAAGGAKLLRLRQTRKTLGDFGVPSRHVASSALALPVANNLPAGSYALGNTLVSQDASTEAEAPSDVGRP